LTLRVLDAKSSPLHLAGVDEAVRTDKRVAIGNAEPVQVSQFLARAGSLLIECTWQGQTADQALAERLLREVQATAK
jgi:hypothetical protein